MESTVKVTSSELDSADLLHLLQAIRDCEQKHFKDKTILIMVDAPELKTAQMEDILDSIRPGFDFKKVIHKP
jgi:hypothetical protein